MANSIFSVSVIKSTDRQFKEEIKDAILGNADFKKEINKILQQANRRIQNIEKANLATIPEEKFLIGTSKKSFNSENSTISSNFSSNNSFL